MGWRRVREESSLVGWSDSGLRTGAGQDRDLEVGREPGGMETDKPPGYGSRSTGTPRLLRAVIS
jgi:hypothetical protein